MPTKFTASDRGKYVNQDTIPGDTTTDATISIDETVSGFLDEGDEDWYAIDLVAGQTIQINLYGVDPEPDSGPIGLSDPVLGLYDSAGDVIVRVDNSGSRSAEHLTFTATTTGTYFLEVDAFIWNDQRGHYELSVHDLIGGPDPDIFYGNENANIMFGHGGDDQIDGLDGNDRITGGTGNDVLLGRNGADTISGNDGQDELRGGGGNDILHGGASNDLLIGGNGHDTLNGGTFNDRLYGDNGNDRIRGGDGEDMINGGLGADFLFGGSDTDFFIYQGVTDSTAGSSADRIFDFAIGEDIIDLSGVIAAEFDFIGTGVFSGNGPEVRVNELRSGSSVVQADTDGDTIADMSILISNAIGLTATDFVL